MNILKGFYITCEVMVQLYNPQLNAIMGQSLVASCLVVDDQFMPVGTPGNEKHPIIVDCSSDKNFKMLAPGDNGIFLFYKGEQCEQ